MFNIEAFIWYFFLLDSLGATIMAWFDGKWYKTNFRTFSRYFPEAKGWCTYYLFLVLWIGWIYTRLEILPW